MASKRDVLNSDQQSSDYIIILSISPVNGSEVAAMVYEQLESGETESDEEPVQ